MRAAVIFSILAILILAAGLRAWTNTQERLAELREFGVCHAR